LRREAIPTATKQIGALLRGERDKRRRRSPRRETKKGGFTPKQKEKKHKTRQKVQKVQNKLKNKSNK